VKSRRFAIATRPLQQAFSVIGGRIVESVALAPQPGLRRFCTLQCVDEYAASLLFTIAHNRAATQMKENRGF
jgi:CBS-domain-containing membrane protein